MNNTINIGDVIASIPVNFLILSVLLIIISLWLRDFNPPIKRQWQSLLLFLVSGVLGYFMLGKTISDVGISLCICGLVFYKDKLVDDIKTLKDNSNVIDIMFDKNNKKDTDDTNNKEIDENDKKDK
jgi:TctA family transporter